MYIKILTIEVAVVNTMDLYEYLNSLTDLTDYHYACEVWDSMTKTEQLNCTPEKMDAYIKDTYIAVSEME